MDNPHPQEQNPATLSRVQRRKIAALLKRKKIKRKNRKGKV